MLFDRPTGSNGANDTPNNATPTTTDTTAPPTTDTTVPTTVTPAADPLPGTYTYDFLPTTCNVNGGGCGGTTGVRITVTCTSTTTCEIDFGGGTTRTFIRSGNVLTKANRSETLQFTCDGVDVPTTDNMSLDFHPDGTVTVTSVREAAAVPPSCPDPYLVVTEGSGRRL